jgi:uncharacterized protein
MSSLPPSKGAVAAAARDLTDDELSELGQLLAATPEPLQPCDTVVLDGFLCGVLVQPRLIAPEAWLPHVFDIEGRPLPADADADWLERTRTLVLRRHAALNLALADEAWFDPIVLVENEITDEDEATKAEDEAHPLAGLPALSRPLAPWVAGFQQAQVFFPDLEGLPDDAVQELLDLIYRHLPPETEEERARVDELNREAPLADLDEALQELVLAVADVYQLTSEQRYRVETVRRETPKVGRNDPCPCGSGRKYKHCHGA